MLALLADQVFGEPRRHPLVVFGKLATRVETWARRLPLTLTVSGLLAWSILVLPVTFAVFLLQQAVAGLSLLFVSVVLLAFCLGRRSLREHARAIAAPLQAGDLDCARGELGKIVSRDTAAYPPAGIAAATVESVLENGSDAVIATLFWFVVAGPAGALLHRLVNTLDAMWGYRNKRYLAFGCCAARADDLMNWPAARLCALAYAIAGQFMPAWRCWHQQSAAWDSPNAGAVMAAGAGALQLSIGGPALYHGKLQQRPQLGCGETPSVADIERSLRLLDGAVLVVVGGILILGVVF